LIQNIWRDRSIGKKYGFVFAVVMLTFLLSVAMTYSLLSNTSDSIQDTRSKNKMVTDVSSLMSLYQEKYLFIPEYIINDEDLSLLGYLSLSEVFVDTAKDVRRNLVNDEQLTMFNQIISNNHRLDDYYFSEIVPNVQQINTVTFAALQSNANLLKEETMSLGEQLKEEAIASNHTSIDAAQDNITQTITILIGSIVVSLLVSITLILLISRSIRHRLHRVVATSDEIAKGNLDVEYLPDEAKDEIGYLSKSINHMKTSLTEMIVEVSNLAKSVEEQVNSFSNIADEVKEGSEQVSLTIEELASGATNQANEANVISERTQDLTRRVIDANKNGEQLAEFSQVVLSTSISGDKQMKESLAQMNVITDVVEQSVTKIHKLDKQTSSISEFVSVIRSIAEQTNLLALNASIEAARAGQAGKGFAVVAEEVRKLAEEVKRSVESITSIVGSIKEETTVMVNDMNSGYLEVSKGKAQIETSGQYFSDIKGQVSNMAERVQDISSALSMFHKSSEDINTSVEHIAAISEESAAGSEEVSASIIEQQHAIHNVSSGSIKLRDMVDRMNKLIERFQTSNSNVKDESIETDQQEEL